MANFCIIMVKSIINAYEGNLNFIKYHSAFWIHHFILICLCTLHTSTLIRAPHSVKYEYSYLPVAPFSVTFDSILCVKIIFEFCANFIVKLLMLMKISLKFRSASLLTRGRLCWRRQVLLHSKGDLGNFCHNSDLGPLLRFSCLGQKKTPPAVSPQK